MSTDWHVFERLTSDGGDRWRLVCRVAGTLSEEKALERAERKQRHPSNLAVAFKPRDAQHSSV